MDQENFDGCTTEMKSFGSSGRMFNGLSFLYFFNKVFQKSVATVHYFQEKYVDSHFGD